MIGDPPSDAGGVQETVAEFIVAVTDTDDGAEGTVGTKTAFDATDGPLEPLEFVAVTVNEYVTAGVSPVTTHVVAAGVPVEVHDPPLSPVTVYDVTPAPEAPP